MAYLVLNGCKHPGHLLASTCYPHPSSRFLAAYCMPNHHYLVLDNIPAECSIQSACKSSNWDSHNSHDSSDWFNPLSWTSLLSDANPPTTNTPNMHGTGGGLPVCYSHMAVRNGAGSLDIYECHLDRWVVRHSEV